jgi:hypothetical protein
MNLLKPAPEGAEQGLCCDFCAQPVVHMFEVQAKPWSMVAVSGAGSLGWGSSDPYCSCPECWDLIQAKRYGDLLARCLLSLPEDIISGLPLEVLVEIYSNMWASCFGKGFLGEVSASDISPLQSVGRVC